MKFTTNILHTRGRLAPALTAAGLCVAGSSPFALDATPAKAYAPAQGYDIPAGPLTDALNRLADVSGAQLAYDAGLARRRQTRGVSGKRSLPEALNALLSGTDLTYKIDPTGQSVSILLAENDKGFRTDARGAQALPTIEVGARTKQRVSGPTKLKPFAAGPSSPSVSSPPAVEANGFGGAGPVQDPFNKTYVLEKASTATKTNTPVMDTPLNVQSVTQQVLRDQQSTTLMEALRNVSGIFTPSGAVGGLGTPGGRFTVRGFPIQTIYRDGFRLDTSQEQSDFLGWTQMANVASVEVLKGPGAVLYGLSEPGGIINIITKEPLNRPYFSLQQQFGSFANYRTTFDVSGPITTDQSLLYRVNVSYQENGAPFGYPIDFTNSKNFFVSPVVKWNIDSATWVKVEASFSSNRASAYFQGVPALNGQLVSVPRSWNYSEPSPESQRFAFAALTWSHNINSDWTIKQQLAFNRLEVSNSVNFTDSAVDSPSGPVFLRNQQYAFEKQTTLSNNIDLT